MRFILVAAAATLLAACASTPPAKPVAEAVPPAPDSKVAATAQSPEDDKFATIDASNIAEAQKAGYKVVNDEGQQLFCKRDLVTGTRLRYRTTCLTAAQLQEISAKAREAMTPSQIPAYIPPDR